MLLRKNQNLVGPLYIIQNKYKRGTYQQSLLILPKVYAAPSTDKKKYLTKCKTDLKPIVDPSPSPRYTKKSLRSCKHFKVFKLKIMNFVRIYVCCN